MNPRRGDRENGFTLIEVLVCTVLLTLGAAAVSSLLGSGFVRSDANSALTHAVDLGTAEMEDLRSLNFAALVSRAAPNSPDLWHGLSFTIQSTVTPGAPAPNLSAVVVTVTWAQRGRNYSYALNTVYGDTRN